MNWFTSDLHFGHVNVIEYCKRPFESVEHMNDELVRRWNERVHPNDTIFVCGDMSFLPFAAFLPIAQKLNGKKILIRGNHDNYSDSQYAKAGFDVYTELKMKIAGKTFRLSHYPYALPWYRRPFAFKSELRYMDKRPPRIAGEFLMHGHTHSTSRLKDNRVHIGVDAWNYAPVSAREIESLIAKEADNE